MDATHIISEQVKSKDLPICVQAAWSLGNLCDVLRGREEVLTPLVYVQLLDACLSTCKNHERVRVNSIRALGHLLYGLQDKHLSERHSVAGHMYCMYLLMYIYRCCKSEVATMYKVSISSGAAKVSVDEMFNAISSSVHMYVLRCQCCICMSVFMLSQT